MNKAKMGSFLKKLREDKKISQEKLAQEFAKSYFEVSTNAISGWEKGKSIPDIDKLSFLADFYGVTVDDILDGEKCEEIDYDNIYHIHQSDYFNIGDLAVKRSSIDPTTNPVYYSTTAEGETVRKRFKMHVFNYIDESISRSGFKELLFFLKHYYILNEDINIPGFLGILKQLKKKDVSKEEKWWEVQKYVRPIDLLTLTFGNIADEEYLSPTVQRRMNYSELWEKDYLLAAIQFNDPIVYDPEASFSKYIEIYEKEHNKVYDREQIIKDTIRYLINNGAMVNRNFLSYQKGRGINTRVVDTLERAHNAVVKAIPVCVKKDNNLKFYYAENNKKNRFLIKNEHSLVKPLRKLGYSYDEMFELINNNLNIPDDVYLRMAKLKGVDMSREFRYVKADVCYDPDILSLQHYWPIYHHEENVKNVYESANLEKFEEELANGVFTNLTLEFQWVGGTDIYEKYKYVISQKSNMSYKEFLKGRQQKRTKQLLESLDSLTTDQIRMQFFQYGGQEND